VEIVGRNLTPIPSRFPDVSFPFNEAGPQADKRGMERRQTPRQQTALPATMTLLSEPPEVFDVVVEDLSGAGARIRFAGRIEAGVAVQLALDDALYLGEIMYCTESRDGTKAGVALRHSLTHVKDLAALMQRLVPGVRPIAPVSS
jgi:hypothetical protein